MSNNYVFIKVFIVNYMLMANWNIYGQGAVHL